MELEYRAETIHQRVGNEERVTEVLLPVCGDDTEDKYIGIYGQRHLRYIREHRPGFCSSLALSGRLNDYLDEVNEQAESLLFRLVNDMAATEGVSERLKEDNQMEWVRRMNSIRNRAEEIVNREIIFA